jgi:hypothetical protein
MNCILRGARACAILSGVLTALSTVAIAASGNHAIYMGAPDCPYCRQYEAFYEKDIMAACRASGVPYRRVMLSTIKDAAKAEKWPADLRPLFSGKGGTPHFIVVQDGHVVAERNTLMGRLSLGRVCKG